MQKLRHLAQSTISELKEVLHGDEELGVDEDEEEEDEEGAEVEKMHQRSLAPAASVEQAPPPLLPPPALPGSIATQRPRLLDEEAVVAGSDTLLVSASDRTPAERRLSGVSPVVGAATTPAAGTAAPPSPSAGPAPPSKVSAAPADWSEEAQARALYSELVRVPELRKLLQPEPPGGDGEHGGPTEPLPVPAPMLSTLALRCTSALQVLAPRALAVVADDASTDDRQRLLASFSDRYDALLRQHQALQKRCREMQEDSDANEQLTVWKSAYATATTRIEELSMDNADLREKLRTLEDVRGGGGGRGGSDSLRSAEAEENEKVKRDLFQKLARRSEEVTAASDALARLQDVVDTATSQATQREAALLRDLDEARHKISEAEEALGKELARSGGEKASATATEDQQRELQQRCKTAEAELQEASQALEVLLQEKERFMEEREHAADKRFVTSVLASCLEHIASDDRGMAERVLTQTLHLMGGESAVEECRRLRGPKGGAGVSRAEPLSQAFVEWLDQETMEAESSQGTLPRV
eukprot:NODE_4254_length_1914_cov_3.141578.p1 GENE.NODE_4254_length_1914_cov_3.141578~~NODE_4254_length_1914_cov_3.141578.p1  ORF type:complete len:530 (-),score=155.47 NODE_4254_length_1914_cov_3.141578:104-1693(-)